MSNLTRRRAMKANHRKRVLKERRTALPQSLADRVRQFAGGPINRCVLQREAGIGSLVLARDASSGEIAMAVFLIDWFALGIKDVLFDVVEPSDFELNLAMLGMAAPLMPVEPSYARKLVRDAAAYAASLGLRPHRGFSAIEQLFGDVRSEDCSESFVFGCEGRPLYVPGPIESPAQVIRRLTRLEEHLGPDGFDVAIPDIDDE